MSECTPWWGATFSTGYGRVRHEGKDMLAHRYIYETVVGPIPVGLELDHACHNPICVNVDHLEPVTHAENMRRSLPALRNVCLYGHPLNEENTYRNPKNGGRSCKQCRRAAVRRLRARRANSGL